MNHRIKLKQRDEDEIHLHTPTEFHNIFGIEYAETLQFESIRTEERVIKQCAKALKKRAIENERKWLGAWYTREINNHHIADIAIKWIDPFIGYGVFAEKPIPPRAYIGSYTGVIKKQSFFFHVNDYCFSYPTSALFLTKHSIDASRVGNETRFINHSLHPNCEAIGVFYNQILHIIIRAISPIAKGEQLFYDYGNELFNDK